MILIALGGNLPTGGHGPDETIRSALDLLAADGVRTLRLSRLYRSAPVPVADQPDFVNAVAAVATGDDPAALLARLHSVEQRLGRIRRVVNEARPIDLDLLDHQGRVSAPGAVPVLPHPRMTERAFVLLPLRDVAPEWCDPRDGKTLDALIAALPSGQRIEAL